MTSFEKNINLTTLQKVGSKLEKILATLLKCLFVRQLSIIFSMDHFSRFASSIKMASNLTKYLEVSRWWLRWHFASHIVTFKTQPSSFHFWLSFNQNGYTTHLLLLFFQQTAILIFLIQTNDVAFSLLSLIGLNLPFVWRIPSCPSQHLKPIKKRCYCR